ncbi:hypothetical protein GCM10027610_004420 [Dactylosporangium cerinum]
MVLVFAVAMHDRPGAATLRITNKPPHCCVDRRIPHLGEALQRTGAPGPLPLLRGFAPACCRS